TEYGSLSVAVQYYFTTEIECSVPHTVFILQPNVDSAVIKLTLQELPAVEDNDEAFCFRVVLSSIAQRHKSYMSNLLALIGKDKRAELSEVLESINIDASRRGETLSLEEYAALSGALSRSGLVI